MAISAGYSPIAISTDTGGSIITPSTRAALFALRPSIHLISQRGIVPISPLFDTAGPMAKTVIDLANLLDVLVKPHSIHGKGSFRDALPGSFSDFSIGALNPEKWFFDAGLQRPVASATAQIVKLSQENKDTTSNTQ